ncbi:hypothetical protein [Chondromyces crocatus]|uniref:Uncharacterized protein n=1 Tax=Chondromyces crocatus TaxID=52 RepID=A0A0K1EMY5_CHOCO|nr:hypothetical protein [Chondromyces crocatus]AKT42017.1 uncharacterized protein CMC5_062390 [Chondromyces crocatus]
MDDMLRAMAMDDMLRAMDDMLRAMDDMLRAMDDALHAMDDDALHALAEQALAGDEAAQEALCRRVPRLLYRGKSAAHEREPRDTGIRLGVAQRDDGEIGAGLGMPYVRKEPRRGAAGGCVLRSCRTAPWATGGCGRTGDRARAVSTWQRRPPPPRPTISAPRIATMRAMT